MPDSYVDASELDRLSVDLSQYGEEVAKDVDKALEVNARNIKDA